ncbi:MAG: putative Alpha/beta hydrolase [Chlorobi bacterium]|nr:putative Alpha/beta hydrolase [Chlorobiota bacterium]
MRLQTMPYDASQLAFIRTGSGPPVVMIHGNPATHTLWRPLAERLAAARTVYAINLPGFGGSPAPATADQYTLRSLARLVLEFGTIQGFERFDLIGHSFGGAISITMADLFPDSVRSLVAITPMTDRIPMLARLARVAPLEWMAGTLWNAAPSRLRREFAGRWAHVSYGKGYSPGRAAEVAMEADRKGLVRALCGLVRETDYGSYGETLGRLGAAHRQPVLLVGAGEDSIIPASHFEHLCGRFPRAERHIFPESGHVPMWQHPDDLAPLIRRFWEKAGPV